jgi:hypothetical protein
MGVRDVGKPVCTTVTKMFLMVLLSVPHMLYYYLVRLCIALSPARRKTVTVFGRNDSVWLAAGSADPGHWVRPVFVLNGEVSLREVRDRVGDRMVAPNPKLRRCLGKFAGFDVWEEDPEFSVENHVNYLTQDGALVTYNGRDSLVAAVNYATRLPHDKRRPLWRMFLVPREDRPGTLLIFAFSHAIMDGNSLWLNIYPALSDLNPDGTPVQLDPPDVGKDLNLKTRWRLCQTALKGAKRTAKQQWGKPDVNPLKEHGHETGARDVYYPEMFDVGDFRKVSKKFGCSINDVFTSCFTAAVLR